MARCGKCANLNAYEIDGADGDEPTYTHECPVADVLPFKGRCREFVPIPEVRSPC